MSAGEVSSDELASPAPLRELVDHLLAAAESEHPGRPFEIAASMHHRGAADELGADPYLYGGRTVSWTWPPQEDAWDVVLLPPDDDMRVYAGRVGSEQVERWRINGNE